MRITSSGNVGIGSSNPTEKLEIKGGKLQLDGNQQIVFKSEDTSNNLKLQLWNGYGLGINSSTLFYAANGRHSWRDNNGNNERMRLSTSADGGLSVLGTGQSSFSGPLSVAKDLVLGSFSSQEDRYLEVRSGAGSKYRSGIKLLHWKGSHGYTIESDESIGALNFRIVNEGKNKLDINALSIQFLNGNVGIGTTRPSAKLEIIGSSEGDVSLIVTGRSSFSGALDAGGNLTVGGELSVSGGMTVTGNLRGRIWSSREFIWEQGKSPTRMTEVSKTVCFLTFVRGNFNGDREKVEIVANNSHWFLQGDSNQRHVMAKARCIGRP